MAFDIYLVFKVIIPLTMAIGIYIFVKRRNNSQEKNIPYVPKDDPTAQFKYEDRIKEKNLLTKEEQIDLSWQFLYDITDVVLNKFSQQDREFVHQMGHKLLQNGGGYEHVIEYGIKKEKKRSTFIDEDVSKTKETSIAK